MSVFGPCFFVNRYPCGFVVVSRWAERADYFALVVFWLSWWLLMMHSLWLLTMFGFYVCVWSLCYGAIIDILMVLKLIRFRGEM